jgi:hypothetical protein
VHIGEIMSHDLYLVSHYLQYANVHTKFVKLEVLECFYTFHVFSLVLWLDSTHCVLVVGVGHDLFLSTQLSRYCLVLMPLQ